jgi:sn-glycerol 3-phosphate transport system ATP-binding protein
MNFLPGRADGNGRIALDGKGGVPARVHLPAGRDVTVGVRPEHVTPCSAADAWLEGTVEAVESLGADTLLHLAVGSNNVIARVPHGAQPAVGSTLHLCGAPERVYLFDAQSGARLRG